MWHYGRFKSDPFSDDLIVVIKPVFEIQVSDSRGPSVLSYFLKRNNHPNDTVWFAQVLIFSQIFKTKTFLTKYFLHKISLLVSSIHRKQLEQVCQRDMSPFYLSSLLEIMLFIFFIFICLVCIFVLLVFPLFKFIVSIMLIQLDSDL